jgi:hypothetical protein
LTFIDSDLACTVEGAADVGKSVLKVRRGVAIMGQVTAYSACPQGTPQTLTNDIIGATSSSSSSCSELDHALRAKASGGSEPTSGTQTEAGAVGETPANSLALDVPVTAISEVEVTVSVSMAISHDGVRETTRDQSEPPDAVEGSSPVIPAAKEENSPAESGVEMPLLGKDVSVRPSSVEESIPGLWHVLYDDGSEATLAHLELRSAITAPIFSTFHTFFLCEVRIDQIRSDPSISCPHRLTFRKLSVSLTVSRKAFQDAKEHIKLLKKAKRSALSRDAKVHAEPLTLPALPLRLILVATLICLASPLLSGRT